MVWLRNLLAEMGLERYLQEPTIIEGDNLQANRWASSDLITTGNKFIERDYFKVNERGWCNFIDEGGGAATDAVTYLAVGDVLMVQLSSFLTTKIKDAKTINFICSSTIKVLVERCCQAWQLAQGGCDAMQ